VIASEIVASNATFRILSVLMFCMVLRAMLDLLLVDSNGPMTMHASNVIPSFILSDFFDVDRYPARFLQR
jgi:hypothetical protein